MGRGAKSGLALLATFVPYTGAETTQHPSLCERCDGDGAKAVFHRAQNGGILAQCVFGWLSIVACLAVLAVSYAHGKDRRSLRARIITGLIVANLVFSVGMSIPVAMTVCREDGSWGPISSREDWTTTTHAIAIGLIYAGKYWTIAYETFIVVASVVSLRSGSMNIRRGVEIAAHVACFIIFAVIFGLFVAAALPFLTADYHRRRTDPHVHELQLRYQAYERRTLDGWIAFFSAFVLVWLFQRLNLHRLMIEWDAAQIAAEDDWNRDLWNTRDSSVRDERKRKQQLLDLQKLSYLEVAKPLEPYVYVFVAFSVPAMVLATRWCDEQTERMWNRESGPALNCMSTCLLILAMRPLATAAVYFSDKQCRAELCDARTLGCKFWRRLRGFGAWLLGCASKGRGLRFDRVNLEQVNMIVDDDDDGRGEVDGIAESNADPGESTVQYALMEDYQD